MPNVEPDIRDLLIEGERDTLRLRAERVWATERKLGWEPTEWMGFQPPSHHAVLRSKFLHHVGYMGGCRCDACREAKASMLRK